LRVFTANYALVQLNKFACIIWHLVVYIIAIIERRSEMYDDLKDRHRRDMWKAIPKDRMKEIRRSINEMEKGRDRTILHLAFIDGLTTTEIEQLAQNRDDLRSRNHRPISRRRIQQIILQYVPDANAYQDHSQKDKPHKDHGKYYWSHKKERCANCNGTERLEWHHMIPAILGGTADERNMICLCHECHRAVTEYNRTLFPDEMNSWKKKRAEEQKAEK
jgi:5-methylcytosine-specific restriction endonuclease McrA